MTKLQKYELVNGCETLDELAKAIEIIADKKGMIQGRNRKFDAKKMAECCRQYSKIDHNFLTREFGIRQQALYILFYENKL